MSIHLKDGMLSPELRKEVDRAFAIPDSNSGPGGSRPVSRRVSGNSPPVSCTTIERFGIGDSDQEVERITIACGDFLEVSFVDHQPDAIENNSDRYTFKLTTPGGQPCEIDDREVNEVKFTIVGNWELADFLSGMAAQLHLRRRRQS